MTNSPSPQELRKLLKRYEAEGYFFVPVPGWIGYLPAVSPEVGVADIAQESRVRVVDTDELGWAIGGIAGLFSALSFGSAAGIFSRGDHPTGDLQRDAIDTVAVLLNEHNMAILRYRDDVDPWWSFEHNEFAYLLPLGMATAYPVERENGIVSNGFPPYGFPHGRGGGGILLLRSRAHRAERRHARVKLRSLPRLAAASRPPQPSAHGGQLLGGIDPHEDALHRQTA